MSIFLKSDLRHILLLFQSDLECQWLSTDIKINGFRQSNKITEADTYFEK